MDARPAHAKVRKDEEDWKSACALLARLRNLRNLAVVLSGRRVQGGNEWKRMALEALGKVKVNGSFVVRVGWDETEWERDVAGAGQLPFEIRREFIDQIRA
jgi:hypothetical protein